jgi:type IV secretory pathway TraG/TraD family ATPase VirD4
VLWLRTGSPGRTGARPLTLGRPWSPGNLRGQGLLITLLITLACLQDLSQARGRWGQAADGFFSLFGTKVLLPGIGDMKTLDAVSRLAGQVDVPVRSVNRSAWWSGRPSASTTYSWRRQPRLPVDKAHSLPAGSALVVTCARPPRLAWLTPWWAHQPFADARRARPVASGPGAPGRPRRHRLAPGAPPPVAPAGQGDHGPGPHRQMAEGRRPAPAAPSPTALVRAPS